MQTLKIVSDNNCYIPYSIGKEIGFGGADGQAFEIDGHQDRVIKVSLTYDFDNKNYIEASNVLKYLIDNNPCTYARVYENVLLGEFTKETAYGQLKYKLYYYVMEKLDKLSDDEQKVFHSILSHEDRNIIKNYTLPQIKKILTGLARGLDFDPERVIFFSENFRKCPVIHGDIHIRNIMKDKLGYFKLIDFDRCKLLENKHGKDRE